jgi:ferritin-like metal-binding protein YciE
MVAPEERLMQWLRDAHAMEEQAEQMLSGTAQRLKAWPEIRLRLVKHLEETRRQSIAIQGCIERRGGRISIVKDLFARTTGLAQALSAHLVGDEVVKGLLAVYTFEQMEIASYTILRVAAERVGDSETMAVCESILAEERAMAAWAQEQLEPTTRQYLTQAPSWAA